MKKNHIADEQQLAICNGIHPQTPAEAVAAAWVWVHWSARAAGVKPSPRLHRFNALVSQITTAYFQKAMSEWRPSMLTDLARAMKRLGPPEKWEPDKAAWFLLEASKSGPVNLSEVQRVAQARKVLSQSLRTWRRKAHATGIQTVKPGRPK